MGKIYLDKNLEKVALPIKANTGSSGLGVLPTGSRIKINAKAIRVFTYWEKVNDVDLSCFSVDGEGKTREYSWRYVQGKLVEDALTFSGDVTNGYNGGVEYFDVDLDKYRKLHPDDLYLVFPNNVYSILNFSGFYCKAGFMERNDLEAGLIFEPKTVKSSFIVNAQATQIYAFAIDLISREFVWLNMTSGLNTRIAGEDRSGLAYVFSTLEVGNIINYKLLFSLLGSEFVKNAKNANVVVSDDDKINTNNLPIYHSYDIDKIIKLINE